MNGTVSTGKYDRLPEEYILDERYKIIRMIGEGGFGCTYEAVNIHTGKHAAIKANRQADPQNFLQEARILRDFSEESAIVNVLDYFEEDGTAYLVMEYLDGIPLSEEVRENGKWPTEKAVRSFIPVMHALGKMHAAGVIHRDVSPDNLMVMPDGSLILMDFGAAKEIHEQNFTRNSIYKSIYSPPEQRESGVTLGSYTDVYALCATFYFCITGQAPEDSLSRLLFDELKKPSEYGTDIKPRSEKAVMNGLELDIADRIQKMTELLDVLEKDYPDLSEEEKRILKEKQKNRKKIAFISCCALFIIILSLLYKFRINILFTAIDTQTVRLLNTSMTDEEYRKNAEIVRERVKVFSEGKYLWKEDQKVITFEVPSESFNGKSPFDVTRFFLSRPMVISFYIGSSPKEGHYLGVFTQGKDIISADSNDNTLYVILSTAAAARFNGALNVQEENISIAFDYDSTNYIYMTGTSVGDGKSIRIDYNFQDSDYIISDNLMSLLWNTPPSSKPFSVHADWKVQWEDVNNALFPGKNQRNQDSIPGAALLMRYVPKNEPEESSGYDLFQVAFQAALKNRLDSLDFPYAFGIDRYKKNSYVVKFPAERYWPEEADYLPELQKHHLHFGSSKTMDQTIYPNEIRIITENDGTWQAEVSIQQSNRTEDLFQTLIQQNEKDFYLYFKSRKLFVCPLEEAYKSFRENGKIYFKNWVSANYPEMDDTTNHFGNFLETCLDQNLPTGVFYEADDDVELHDEKGKLVFSDFDKFFPAPLTEKQPLDGLIDKWNQEYGSALKFTYIDNLDSNSLDISATITDICEPSPVLQIIEDFLKRNAKVIESGNFMHIYIYLNIGSDPDVLSESRKSFVLLTLSMDFQTGKFLFPRYFGFTARNVNNWKEIEKTYTSIFESSPFWSQYLRPDPE